MAERLLEDIRMSTIIRKSRNQDEKDKDALGGRDDMRGSALVRSMYLRQGTLQASL